MSLTSLSSKRRPTALVLALLLGSIFAVPALADDHRYYSIFGGTLTKDVWEHAINPKEVEFAGSDLIGIAIGRERQIGASNLSFGIEFQGVKHFGRQDHLEFNLPLILRFHPWSRDARLRSIGLGLGLSYTTRVSQVEIDRAGTSQRLFAYWMAEMEFKLRKTGTHGFLRLHHRSDAYGLFKENSGSTALVLGWRRHF